jgi:superfamily II DNA or RNA helicase
VTQAEQPADAYPPVELGAAARAVLGQSQALRAAITEALAAPEARRQSARRAYELVRGDVVQAELAKMPLDRIKEITQGRLRLAAIEQAGFRTVGAVAAAGPYRLQAIQGVGPQTASQVVAAARQLQAAMEQEIRVRFDPDARTAHQAGLLAELRGYEAAKSLIPPQAPDLRPLAADLDTLLAAAAPASSRFRMFFTRSNKKQEARDGLSRLAALIQSPSAVTTSERLQAARRTAKPDATWLWNDYLARPVVYNGLLIEVAGLTPDAEASQGFLPAEIAQRVRDHPLDLSLVTASLRGYQAFGAKFALVQQRVIIGDEMGLGKTIQALAAMCHLAADGARHFLVICPASVIVNWTREIQRHTKLDAYRLHGLDRERNHRMWMTRGGVAVTTYDALRTMPMADGMTLGMLTVDEAHYTKNPSALRTKAVRKWAARTGRVLFLTGTPMENRVEEFRTLVGHLVPGIAATVRSVDGAVGGTRFRKAVAPVYLRRNQDDVLSELPPRLETEDWVELDGRALLAYRAAVYAGNFMAMRRAAYAPGTVEDSAKLRRLVEIADEAAADGHKVVVFSFFRDVLATVAAVLGPKALGPLTGSVPPSARQAMVDEFTARTGPSVLVSQIQAGGVGLNIQAASVVIIAEPQWTPAIEEQAIARCHRMGQVRRVDVHRLLTEDSVDQRMLEILRVKADEFNEYARRSDLRDATPDAVDISDLAAAKEAATRAEHERRIVEMERKRLRMEEAEKGSR